MIGRGLGTGRFVSRGLGPRLKKSLYAIVRESGRVLMSATRRFRSMAASTSGDKMTASTEELLADASSSALNMNRSTTAENQAGSSGETDMDRSSSEGTLEAETDVSEMSHSGGELDMDKETKRIEEPI